MNSKEYWRLREEEALKHYVKDEREYDRQIKQIYSRMLDACQNEIDAFYGRYATKEGISIAEAKKRVSQADIKAYERKAKQYVKEKNFSDEANEEMRLYNLTMKVNRLEMLKANIGLELIAGHDELQKFMAGVLKGRTMAELKRQAGILGKTIQNNAKLADSIVNASFHNAKFSDRIWQYQDLMRADLSKTLQTGLIQGKNPRAIAGEMRKYWYGNDPKTGGGAVYCMERLMRTELARVQTDAQKKSFEKNGFEEFMFIVNRGCCPICQGLDGKHFKVSKMMPGENAPPIHPHCRCSVAAYEDSAEYEAWLDYLASGGSTEEWEKTKAIRTATESGSYGADVKRVGTNEVDLEYIKSAEFRKKFSRITDNTAVNDALRKYAEAMLTHRNGTDGEDLYIINSKTGQLLLRKISGKDNLGVAISNAEIEELRKSYFGNMIGIHNHPTNNLPTGSDFAAAGYRGYDFGVVVTHSGKVFIYKVGDTPFLPQLFDRRVDKYTEEPYNFGVEKAHVKVLSEFKKEYGVSWEEIT